MRNISLRIFSVAAGVVVEQEFQLFKRDEFIDYVEQGNINPGEYSLELYAPFTFECCIDNLLLLDPEDEVFVFEDDKSIILYLDNEEEYYEKL